VSSCVRYGTACLLIRDVVRGVRCSDEWEFGVVTDLGSHGGRWCGMGMGWFWSSLCGTV
jgi:hypothetical protein